MNKKAIKTLTVIGVGILLMSLSGCDSNPIGKLVDPTVSNTTGQFSGTWVIYNDGALRITGGFPPAIMFMTTPEGQTLDLNSTDHPYSGNFCLKYAWNGDTVTWYQGGIREDGFVGFIFIAAPTVSQYGIITRNLGAGGYTKISFYVRGALNANVSLRLESQNANNLTPSGVNAWQSNTTNQQITSNWQHYEFAISGSMASVSDILRIILVYNESGNPNIPNVTNGNGGTVFLDNIEYLK
ncbi:MAG: hypothetical protein ABSH12_05230 [Endomicrobiales bacterium]|jgi:hypothetical protein